MATSQEVLTNIIRLSGTRSTSSTLEYTVPAGKYAEVFIQSFSSTSDSNGVVIGPVVFAKSVTAHSYNGSSTNSEKSGFASLISLPIPLIEGETITTNAPVSGSVSFSYIIKEYNKP